MGDHVAPTAWGRHLIAFTQCVAAEPLKLEPGKPVTLTCKTQSIVIKDDGPAPTKGAVTLRLEVKDPAAASTWTPLTADDAHKGTFVSLLRPNALQAAR